MRLKLALFSLLAALAFVLPLGAQEGHPLTGTWLGEWGTKGDQITMVVNWNGKKKEMEGIFNVENPMPIKMVLDSTKWTVHIETTFKDDNGKTSLVIADGKLDNIGSYHRTISGTWQQGTEKGNFKLTRD